MQENEICAAEDLEVRQRSGQIASWRHFAGFLLIGAGVAGLWLPCSLLPIPYSLLPIPYSLLPIPYSLLPIPYSLFPTPYSLLPVPYSLFPYTDPQRLHLAIKVAALQAQ